MSRAILVIRILCVALSVILLASVEDAEAQDAGGPRITTGPTIISEPSVDSDNDGRKDTYGPTDVIEIEVGFSEQVCGYGSLFLTFQTDDNLPVEREAEYGGCGPDRVYFRYLVSARDVDGDGFSIASNSISLRTYDGIVPDASHVEIPSNPDHKVNGSLPDITPPAIGPGAPSITNSPSYGDTYGRGEGIHIEVSFTEPVDVDTAGGPPTIELEIGGRIRRAQYSFYSDISGTALIFVYSVQQGDRDDDDVVWVPAGGLVIPFGSYIRDASGNDADLSSWSASSGVQWKIDGRVPPKPAASTIIPPKPAAPITPANLTPSRSCIEEFNASSAPYITVPEATATLVSGPGLLLLVEPTEVKVGEDVNITICIDNHIEDDRRYEVEFNVHSLDIMLQGLGGGNVSGSWQGRYEFTTETEPGQLPPWIIDVSGPARKTVEDTGTIIINGSYFPAGSPNQSKTIYERKVFTVEPIGVIGNVMQKLERFSEQEPVVWGVILVILGIIGGWIIDPRRFLGKR